MVLDSNGWWWWWWWWCSSISEVNDLLKVLEDHIRLPCDSYKAGSLVVCLCSAMRPKLWLIKVYRVPPPVAFASGRQYAKLGGGKTSKDIKRLSDKGHLGLANWTCTPGIAAVFFFLMTQFGGSVWVNSSLFVFILSFWSILGPASIHPWNPFCQVMQGCDVKWYKVSNPCRWHGYWHLHD